MFTSTSGWKSERRRSFVVFGREVLNHILWTNENFKAQEGISTFPLISLNGDSLVVSFLPNEIDPRSLEKF